MRSPLHSRISDLRGRVRRLLALHGLSLVVAGLAVFTLLACLADWSIHLAREVRVALLLTFVGLAGYLLMRYVIAPLVVRFRDLDIALKIENRWPGLNDRLASTIQFLDLERAGVGDRDDLLGSKALRDATVKQTLAETASIDFREVVDPRPARKAMLIGSAAVALGLGVFALDTRLGSLAVKRLFLPFASNPWPQMTHLAILQAPAKVAKGEPFVLEVGVASYERAPSFAKVTYTYEDGEKATESLRPDAKNRFHGRKEAAEKSFTFTVAAGDDKTADRKVLVVPAPVVTATTVKLTYPAYTAMPPQTLATVKNTITAVRGTIVEIVATANKPIASASLTRVEGQKPLAARVDAAKPNTLSAKFTLEDSGPLTFALNDTEGFHSQEKDAVRLDLRAIKDEAPKVVIEEPTNDKDVTPNADVPLEISADDDFGLGNVRLVYKSSVNGSEPVNEVIVPLWAATEGTKEKPAAPAKHHAVMYRWKLEPLKLPVGTLLTFHADSRDLDNLKGPNVGKSRELHLRIVSPDQLAAQIESQRREIREEIERTLTMQKQALAPVRDAVRTLDKTDQLDAARREEVKNAEPIQQQITDRIANKTDGLEAKIRKHLEELENLKIDNPDAKSQMQGMLESVEKLRDENLSPAEQGLTRAAKTFDQQNGEKSPTGEQPKDQNQAGTAAQKSEAAKAQEKATGTQGKSAKSDAAKSDASAKQGEPKAGESSKPDASAKSGESSKSDAAAKSGEMSKSEAAKSGESSKSDATAKSGESKSGESSKSDASAKSGESKSASAKSQPSGKSSPQKGGEPKADSASPPQAPSSVKDSLKEAEKNQKAIADGLQRMKDELGEFETYRGVVDDAKKLLKEHEAAMKAATEMAQKPDLADKPADALTPQQKNDLAAPAEQQKEAATNLSNLENKMDELAKKLEASDPASAAALKDAAQQSRERGTAGKMEKAAQSMEKNQMGQAQADQKQAQQDLKKLVDNLQNRRENELARLVKDLKDAEKEMQNLSKRQQQNKDQTAKAKENQDQQARKDQLQKLAKEQKQIAQDLKKQLLKLQKARVDAAAQAGEKAAAKMAQAGQQQEEDDPDDAAKMQEEALAGLEEAQDEIEEARKDAEEQLAMEQLSKIKDNLLGLSDRQAKMAVEITEYDTAKAAKGLTLAQRAGVRSLGRVQEALKDETDELTERLDAAPAFALQLKKAANQMGDAAKKLQGIQTDMETQKVAQSAHKKVKQLIDALNPNSDEEQKDGQKPSPPGGQPGQPGLQPRNRGDGISLAAQLRVLKSLQVEINDRTEAIDEIKTRKKSLTADQQAELEGLSDDQRKIADLARDLTKPKKSDGEQ
jgi:hypothetical protein